MFYLNVFKTKMSDIVCVKWPIDAYVCLKHMVSYVTYATFEELPNMDFEIINGSS